MNCIVVSANSFANASSSEGLRRCTMNHTKMYGLVIIDRQILDSPLQPLVFTSPDTKRQLTLPKGIRESRLRDSDSRASCRLFFPDFIWWK